MTIKTLVKVGKITNLSDARYCAGMGVELLGFRVAEGDKCYISSKQFQELRGWISGPAVVAEIYGIKDHAQLTEVIQNYLPDYIELSVTELPLIQSPSSALILSTTAVEFKSQEKTIMDYHNQVAYIVVPSSSGKDSIQELSQLFPVLLFIENDFEIEMLKDLPVKGIVMEGSSEEKPGLKNYDHLATVLERLDII